MDTRKLNGIIDRIEGELAVIELEDGSFTNVPVTKIPPGISESEGVALTYINDELISLKANFEYQQKLQAEIAELEKDVLE